MYDILYIGGGLNYAGAIVAAKKGFRAGLIEKDLGQLGGVCLHKGCIPSKMFLHYANTLYESKKACFKGEVSLDMSYLQQEKRTLVQTSLKAIAKQCAKVTMIEGEAKIVAPHTVEVLGKCYKARNIVIGTGSKPFIPKAIAYDKSSIITSDEVLQMQTLPEKIAIYGDGAIGLEMASFFAACGVQVTLISRHEGKPGQAHPLLRSAMLNQLQNIGIKRLNNHPIAKAKRTKQGVHVMFENGSSSYFDKLLVATGRIPNTDVIKTDSIQIRHGIVTDNHFETTLPKHYAIGDCNGKIQLAHAARAQTLYVTEKITGNKPRVLNLDHVVRFIHTLPMGYASVGLTKNSLQQRDISFKESIVSLSQFNLAHFYDATSGTVIVYTDKSNFILGAEILAPYAEELIAPVAMALAGEMDKNLAQKTIMAHPSFAEAIERAFFRL